MSLRYKSLLLSDFASDVDNIVHCLIYDGIYYFRGQLEARDEGNTVGYEFFEEREADEALVLLRLEEAKSDSDLGGGAVVNEI